MCLSFVTMMGMLFCRAVAINRPSPRGMLSAWAILMPLMEVSTTCNSSTVRDSFSRRFRAGLTR